jgi:transcriptional regulator with XRE-family HTH domain
MPHIKRYIEIKGISQREFSNQTGLDYYQVSRLVNGSQKFTPAIMRKILDAYPDFNAVGAAPDPEFLKPLPVLNEPTQEYSKKIPFYDTEVFATISPDLLNKEMKEFWGRIKKGVG